MRGGVHGLLHRRKCLPTCCAEHVVRPGEKCGHAEILCFIYGTIPHEEQALGAGLSLHPDMRGSWSPHSPTFASTCNGADSVMDVGFSPHPHSLLHGELPQHNLRRSCGVLYGNIEQYLVRQHQIRQHLVRQAKSTSSDRWQPKWIRCRSDVFGLIDATDAIVTDCLCC